MVRLVRTVCTNAANTASKMKLATNLTVIVLMVVTLVGMEKRVTEVREQNMTYDVFINEKSISFPLKE